jgi:hypothetical protein
METHVPLRNGPVLVASRARQPHAFSRQSPLVQWHLLSLDAPTVATVWTLFIARCAGVALPWRGPMAMFVAVWMLYAADRLLDARPQLDGSSPPDLEERHRFHHRHRTAFLSAIAAASGVLAVLLHGLNPRAMRLYALLAALLAAWLLLIHARPLPTDTTRRLPKELAVGLFFPAAIFIPTVARAPQLRLVLLPAAALMAAVCTLNCLLLYAWEHAAPRTQAHWTTRWATAHLTPLAACIVATALFVAVFSTVGVLPGLDRAPALACAFSATLLFALQTQRRRWQPVTIRACADLVLLTPLIWMLGSR